MREAQELMWNNGTRLRITGAFVNVGTEPEGSTWARNPIPRIHFDDHSSGQSAGFRVSGTAPCFPRLLAPLLYLLLWRARPPIT